MIHTDSKSDRHADGRTERQRDGNDEVNSCFS